MKILNFGSCNIDYVYSLDHIVGVGETETTCKLETFPGGKGLNQSIAVAKAGAKIYHAGCVGCDGNMLIDILLKTVLTFLISVKLMKRTVMPSFRSVAKAKILYFFIPDQMK